MGGERRPDLARFYELALDPLCVLGPAGFVVVGNPAFRRRFGEETIGLHLTDMFPDDAAVALGRALVALQEGETEQTITITQGSGGRSRWTLVRDERGLFVYALGQPLPDGPAATGGGIPVALAIPGDQDFREVAVHALARARRHHRLVGLLLVELEGLEDRMAELPEAARHRLLRATASRLRDQLREEDRIARLSRGVFAVLVEDLRHAHDAGKVAEKILDVLSRPLPVAGTVDRFLVGCGIAVFPADGEEPATLIQRAEQAVEHALRAGKSGYRFAGA